jgi:hypothetical protein
MVFRPSRVLGLFVALLLVFAQQQATLHSLGHAFEDIQQQKDFTPHQELCAKCLAVAHLDHAVAVAPMPLEPLLAAPILSSSVPYEDARLTLVSHYRSRAPPLFS